MSNIENEVVAVLLAVAWELEGKGKESRHSQPPEGIDFSCRLLFQSWLEARR
jgi:hypothetical protein